MHIAHQQFELSPYNSKTIHVGSAKHGVVHRGDDKRYKVAIVGAGIGKEYAPYDDPAWEVWSLNAVPALDRFSRLRCDRWFEMHIIAAQNTNDLAWMIKCPVPMYLVPDACSWEEGCAVYSPQQVRYPLEIIEWQIGSYFACSFAYMIALALWEGFTDIGIFGAEMCYGTERERTVEWACVSWWMGLAQGRGASIHLPSGSHLGNHRYRYGIEYYEEKRDVEHYVDMMRKADKARNVNTDLPYDSAREFSQGG